MATRLHAPDDPLVEALTADPANKVRCPKHPGALVPVAWCAKVHVRAEGYDEIPGAPCPLLAGFVDVDRGPGAPLDQRPFCKHPYVLRVHRVRGG